MELNKDLMPSIVSIHLGLKDGKAQVLVEADLAALAIKEGESASPAVKAILGVVSQMIKLVP